MFGVAVSIQRSRSNSFRSISVISFSNSISSVNGICWSASDRLSLLISLTCLFSFSKTCFIAVHEPKESPSGPECKLIIIFLDSRILFQISEIELFSIYIFSSISALRPSFLQFSQNLLASSSVPATPAP